jgi:nitroreductase
MAGTDIFMDELNMSGGDETLPTINAEEFFKVIETRRSVRVYTKDPIPEEVVRRCLRAATLAPNSSNMQPWEMYWVRDAAKREKLVDACLSQPAARTAAELVVFVARTRSWPEMRKRMLDTFSKQKDVPKAALDYYQKLIPLALEQGPLGVLGAVKKVVMFARGLSKPTPRGPASASDMEVWAQKSVALACENYMLAMRASGFDTCPMEGFDESRIRSILQLPSDAHVVMVISAGKRAANGIYGPRIRFEESLFIKEL